MILLLNFGFSEFLKFYFRRISSAFLCIGEAASKKNLDTAIFTVLSKMLAFVIFIHVNVNSHIGNGKGEKIIFFKKNGTFPCNFDALC